MTQETARTLLDERTVDFYGDQILAILVQTDDHTQVCVPIRPICTILGIDWSAQRQRIMRDEVLSTSVVTLTTQTPGDRQRRKHLCLPLDYLHGWLFGITASQVKPELKERITLYRRECFRVLSHAFQTETALTTTTTTDQTATNLTHVRDLALAVAQMAQQQITLENRVTDIETQTTTAHHRLDRAAELFTTFQQRLTSIEDKLQPTTAITEAQATEISTCVKALAELLTSHNPGKNQYQSIFAELYRRFGVSSYKNISRAQYQHVLDFLDDWRNTVQNPTAS